jgi:hypothetical protein
VAEGKKVFESMGCIVCHSMARDYASPKAGPNLYGVFEAMPRTVETVLAPLTSGGEAVDFQFKQPELGEDATVEKHLRDGVDFRERLAGLDAKHLGHPRRQMVAVRGRHLRMPRRVHRRRQERPRGHPRNMTNTTSH